MPFTSPFRFLRRRFGAPAAAALLIVWSAAPAQSPAPTATASAAVIGWSAEQAAAAGVSTVKLGASAHGEAAGLLLPGTAVVSPQAATLVSTMVPGVVQQLRVSVGDAVRAGQPVAQMSSPQIIEWQRELLQAEAQARLAASKLQRDEKLFAEGIIAEVRLQDTRSQHQLAQLAVTERRQMLRLAGGATHAMQAQLTLTAPAAGTVLEVLASPGQRLEAGMPVARLARTDRLSIELQASAEQATRLTPGDRLTIDGCRQPARVVVAAPQVVAGNQAVTVRAELLAPEACLRVGQFVQARATGAGGATVTPGIEVPAEAVVRQGARSYVFVRTPQGFVPTPVTLGPPSGGRVPVRAGLRPGDEVAIKGIAALKGAWAGLGASGEK